MGYDERGCLAHINIDLWIMPLLVTPGFIYTNQTKTKQPPPQVGLSFAISMNKQVFMKQR